ncbi:MULTISPECIES: reverse transcriptase domain-containing protein [unclassified Polaromonas]|uniref:reverse transcriptase domain-containing protein n=1 Tax=unclassified Polaromonas TaxID=2638319 RepID=UPI0018CA00FF|nr:MULTISPECIES: reverse transcriptase domain-containing protein [unclassified Polaromonas]MBG6070264.1 retron-type reverse transcriptase [Polaromonas sp. CG_9.7]MBG6112262.1 retron-type reverse transcriptase [Polaromonas sp. CG_9.2]
MLIRPAEKFRQDFKKKSIELSYNTKVLGTKSIGIDKVNSHNFELRLDTECELIYQKVSNGQYKFTKFKEKLISKGAGKTPRQLSIPTIRDRLTLRILCDYIFTVFPAAKPELPQRKITLLRNSIDSGKFTHFVKIDLQDFYPSIDHSLLISKLRRKIRIPEFKKLIESAITNPTVSEANTRHGRIQTKGVAQGLSISNVLAEVFMLDIDNGLNSIAPVCIRYVDDILLLTNGDPSAVLQEALKLLKKQKLNPHAPGTPDSKTITGRLSDGLNFLGYQLSPNQVSVKPSNILGFESSIVTVFSEYMHRLKKCKTQTNKDTALARFRWALNLKLTGCIYKNQRFGWVFYYSQINDLGILRRIDNTVEKLLNRFKITTPPFPKRMLKAFFESKRKDKLTHRYIVNYDNLTLPKMTKLLKEIGVNVAGLNAVEVSKRFHNLIRHATRNLEKDVSSVS